MRGGFGGVLSKVGLPRNVFFPWVTGQAFRGLPVMVSNF